MVTDIAKTCFSSTADASLFVSKQRRGCCSLQAMPAGLALLVSGRATTYKPTDFLGNKWQNISGRGRRTVPLVPFSTRMLDADQPGKQVCFLAKTHIPLNCSAMLRNWLFHVGLQFAV